MDLLTIYEQMGLSREVYSRGEAVLERLADRFRAIDQTAEANQAKVLLSMQKNRVGANHFAATTGYGYDDDGRERLEKVYAGVFHTEAALVRPQITCGTHALALALRPACAAHVWNLDSSGAEIAGYLRGQTFPAEGEKGWYLICVDGFGTGWGKLAGAVMKNHYPRGLRR